MTFLDLIHNPWTEIVVTAAGFIGLAAYTRYHRERLK